MLARMQNRIGFIGAGNMAEAIARGILSAGVYRAPDIIAADISDVRRALFADQLKIRAIEDAPSIVTQCQTILLCVKPQQMSAMLESIREYLTADHLVITIAAGISTSYIEKAVGKPIRVVRIMPNTAMLVGKGMSGIAAGHHATPADLKTARTIFQAAGEVVEVTEDLLDAVTAVSGSGPAYFFFLVENMIRAGVEMGLSPEVAHKLAVQTAVGSAELLRTSDQPPAELRRRVTSPGGTTHAAISHMESAGVPQAIVDALKAAHKRGRELGK